MTPKTTSQSINAFLSVPTLIQRLKATLVRLIPEYFNSKPFSLAELPPGVLQEMAVVRTRATMRQYTLDSHVPEGCVRSQQNLSLPNAGKAMDLWICPVKVAQRDVLRSQG